MQTARSRTSGENPARFKGHDSLAAVAQEKLGFDPHFGLIVVCRSKRGDRAKILFWDGTGLVMIYERLERSGLSASRLARL